jgi:hypothetical protein
MWPSAKWRLKRQHALVSVLVRRSDTRACTFWNTAVGTEAVPISNFTLLASLSESQRFWRERLRLF